jgi:hypothetical protein
MSGLTEATSPLYVVWGQSPAQEMLKKGQYDINTNMLQLQVGGRRGTSFLQLSRLQAHQGRHVKEKVAERAKDYPATPTQDYPSQRCYATTQPQQQAQLSSFAKACPPQWEK